MNIVYLGAFRFPNCDAAAARVLNIGKALRDCGHQVTFISWGGHYNEEHLISTGVYYTNGFRYIITNELDSGNNFISKFRGRLLRGNKTKKLLTHWPERIDVIITYNGSINRWLLSFCQSHRIKLINDITEWYSYSEMKISEWIPYIWKMLFTQKSVKNKIVISSYLDRFYSSSHNVVVPATCDATDSKWSNSSWTEHSELADFDGITLIYAGNPARKDLLHKEINVVQRLINDGVAIRFLILGITREQYLSHYSSLLLDDNPNKNIIFLGRVSQDSIPSFYRKSDFMVLLRENSRKSNAGFPTKFSEAIISGTPVIANLTSDLRLYLIDGLTGFVVKEPNEDALYATLKEKVLSMSREQIQQMKQNAYLISEKLDYHFYVDTLRKYMAELR